MPKDVHLLQNERSTISDWLARSERLHRTLRPDLPASYEALMRRMFDEGARMAILPLLDEPKALAVYRIHQTTFQGRRFYLDDLVVDEAERGQGLGATLLEWCVSQARKERCDTFALESGVQRAAAHRFYLRHGMNIVSFGLTKAL